MIIRKIFTRAYVPDELSHAWLQHLRDFDTQHPGCHFEVMEDVPDLTLAQMVERVQLDPELTFTKIIERKR
jgi:hypothetical protein